VTADFVTPDLAETYPPARLIGGLDPGATRDRSGLVAIARLAVLDERTFAVVGTKLWRAGHPLTTASADEPGVAEEVAALPCAWHAFAGEASGLGEAIAGQSGVLWRLMAQRSPHAGAARRPPRWRLIEEGWGTPAEDRRQARRAKRLRAQAAAGWFATEMVSVHPSAEFNAASYSALALLVGRQQLLFRASDEELLRQLLTLRVDLSPSGAERVQAPRDRSGHADLASALALATLPFKSRAGWYSRLVALADPTRTRLPEPAVGALPGPIVHTGGGLAISQRPALVSVAGSECTLPGAATPDYLDPEAELPPMRRATR
jgi:hypothetical protein